MHCNSKFKIQLVFLTATQTIDDHGKCEMKDAFAQVWPKLLECRDEPILGVEEDIPSSPVTCMDDEEEDPTYEPQSSPLASDMDVVQGRPERSVKVYILVFHIERCYAFNFRLI